MSQYRFKLYIIKDSNASKVLLERIENLLNNALKDNYSLEVIDIISNPELAIDANVIASPTLILEDPLPQKRIVGHFKDDEKVITNFNLRDQNNN